MVLLFIFAMSLHDAKIIYFCLGFVFLTSTFYAVGARFESDLTNGELNLVVEWNSTDDVVVINPNFCLLYTSDAADE